MRPLAVVVGMLAACAGQAQVTVATNNASSGDYVGCDNSSPFPLRIMQNDNQPIHMYTDNVWRLWMNETATYGTLGAYSNVPAPGFTLLGENVSNFRTNGGPGAFTLLHLAGDDDNAQDRLLRIAPNPFTDRTTLYCTLERAGRMQLMANSADGRSLMVLSEGQREAGEFQYEWSTENLAPGGYYITLLLDGVPVVKRAVKVGR